jgi:hypothetical protein
MIRKRPSKPDPTKVTPAEIIASVEQLFVGEKYRLYRALRRDPALKEFRQLKRKQAERVKVQKVEARHRQRKAA